MDSTTSGNRVPFNDSNSRSIPFYIGFKKMRHAIEILNRRGVNILLVNCGIYDHEWLLRDKTGVGCFILGKAHDVQLKELACCVFCNPSEKFASENRAAIEGMVRFWLTDEESEKLENAFEEKYDIPFLEDNI